MPEKYSENNVRLLTIKEQQIVSGGINLRQEKNNLVNKIQDVVCPFCPSCSPCSPCPAYPEQSPSDKYLHEIMANPENVFEYYKISITFPNGTNIEKTFQTKVRCEL